ncbi:hypothetical protein [Corynebacterium jeddahense]|uniref:DUF4190 domain-containing protein n=1 Tax=Corynebacterium jeddahense TaxID=1414719 RepID=A0ABY7UJ45_9CORY|nr:hypothetical protein [Corynebacterium jeddahense]WCZ38389.1 hypothetical protein CJEDD_03870 [Corynebacterium jeddahense]
MVAPETEPVTDFIPVVDAPESGGERADAQPHIATWERALIALIAGVVAFGGAVGNIWVAFPACVVMVGVLFALPALPSHRGRNGALGRRAGVVLGAVWAIIVAVIALVLFLVPAKFALTGGVITALFAGVVTWGAIAYVDRPSVGH